MKKLVLVLFGVTCLVQSSATAPEGYYDTNGRFTYIDRRPAPMPANIVALYNIRYYVGLSLPGVIENEKVEDLISKAVQSWTEHGERLIVRHEDNVNSSNLIIRMGAVNGSSNCAATPSLPGRFQGLQIILNDRTNWTADQFQGAVARCFGFVVGVPLDNTPGQLMYSRGLPPGVTEPQAGDIVRFQRIYGVRKTLPLPKPEFEFNIPQ